MPQAIQPIASSHATSRRAPGDKDRHDQIVNIFANTYINYNSAKPAAQIAPPLISMENLTMLLNMGADRRHLPSDIPYADHSLQPPHYIDDFIDLLPPTMLEPGGGMVDRRI